jgi:hypothetical protein
MVCVKKICLFRNMVQVIFVFLTNWYVSFTILVILQWEVNMAATPQNVEMEAAKFLHKLIQESTDEPTKLATKLHVVSHLCEWLSVLTSEQKTRLLTRRGSLGTGSFGCLAMWDMSFLPQLFVKFLFFKAMKYNYRL